MDYDRIADLVSVDIRADPRQFVSIETPSFQSESEGPEYIFDARNIMNVMLILAPGFSYSNKQLTLSIPTKDEYTYIITRRRNHQTAHGEI
jgi:hypothetical protein